MRSSCVLFSSINWGFGALSPILLCENVCFRTQTKSERCTYLYILVFDLFNGFGFKIGFCESVLKWRYRAVLNYLNIKGLKIIKKFFLQDFKNFLYFFISK